MLVWFWEKWTGCGWEESKIAIRAYRESNCIQIRKLDRVFLISSLILCLLWLLIPILSPFIDVWMVAPYYPEWPYLACFLVAIAYGTLPQYLNSFPSDNPKLLRLPKKAIIVEYLFYLMLLQSFVVMSTFFSTDLRDAVFIPFDIVQLSGMYYNSIVVVSLLVCSIALPIVFPWATIFYFDQRVLTKHNDPSIMAYVWAVALALPHILPISSLTFEMEYVIRFSMINGSLQFRNSGSIRYWQ